MVLLVMEETENGGDIRDLGSIPGFGRSVEKEMATHSSILAEKNPMDRGAWGLQSMRSQSQTQLRN